MAEFQRRDLRRVRRSLSRPEGKDATVNTDIMLLYFTSGTTGMPKMVNHDFVYPLGHILTARYWQKVEDGGLHFTVADTGWAKSAWGKIYGQWLSGSAVMTYNYDKFVPKSLMEVIENIRWLHSVLPPQSTDSSLRKIFQSMTSAILNIVWWPENL